MELIQELEAAIKRTIESEVRRQVQDLLREVDDAGNLTPVAKLIDSRIAHFLDASLKTPVSSTTPEQVMEIVNNRLEQWWDDDKEYEVNRLLDERIERHEEENGHIDDETSIVSAVVDCFSARSVEREIESKIRDIITNELTFRVSVD